MNFNQLVEDPQHTFLFNLFSRVLDSPIALDENKEPLAIIEIDNIKVKQPQHPFDFCYKFNLSYAYEIDITCNVVDVVEDTIIHTQILTVSFPKYYQNGFFFRTNNFSVPRFRTPIIKCVSKKSVDIFNGNLGITLIDGSTAYFKDIDTDAPRVYSRPLGVYDEEILESDFENLILSPEANFKLSSALGYDIGSYLSFDILKEIGQKMKDENFFNALKTSYAIDYEYNTLDVSLLNAAIRDSYRIAGLKRMHWAKNKKLYPYFIQSFINKAFSTGGGLGIITPDETNSVATESQADRLQFYPARGSEAKRLKYNNSFLSIVCPVDTPETALINKKNEKTIGSTFKHGKAFISVYDKNWNMLDIPLLEYLQSYVLISECVSYNTKTIKDMSNYTCKYGLDSELCTVNNLDNVKYIEREPYTRFSKSVSLIPGVNYTDQIKASIGAKMLGQATAVEGSEPPVVYTGTEKLIVQDSSKVVKSSISGKVKSINPITIENDIGQLVEQYVPKILPLWDGTSIEYKPTVKVGDYVEENQIIACSTEFKDNELSVGCNVKVGFVNYKGYDLEDGLIMSKSCALKFAVNSAASEIIPIYPGKYNFSKSEILNVYDIDGITDLEKIDEFGLPKINETFNQYEEMAIWATKPMPKNYLERLLVEANPNDLDVKIKQFPIGVAEGKIVSIEMFILKSFVNTPAILPLIRHITNIGEVYESDDIDIKGAIAFIKINYRYKNIPKVGDKFSNRYGSKGTLSAIIDDEEMPIDTSDNKPLEMIFAPDSTAKRKNIQQISECELGKLAIEGYKMIVDNIARSQFNRAREILSIIYQDNTIMSLSDEDTVRYLEANSIQGKYLRIKQECIDHNYTPETIGRIMNKLGIQEKTYLFLPDINKQQRNPVIVGNSNIMRLHFLVDQRARATSDDTGLNDAFVAGFGSHRDGGQSLSEMTLWSLQSHNSMEVYDYFTKHVKSDFKHEFSNNLLFLGLGIE